MSTIRIRIAVAVTPNGCWSSKGGKLLPHLTKDEDAWLAQDASAYVFKTQGVGHVVFIEADVPVPEAVTIEARAALTAPGKEGE